MAENLNKYFMQFMLKNGAVSIRRALNYCEQLTDPVSIKILRNLINEINGNIIGQGLKITFANCEVAGEEQIVLLNLLSDEIGFMQTSFTKPELQYFQVILDEIIINEEHKLSAIAALNLTNSLSKDKMELLINQWSDGGYLVIQDGWIYLGIRCILEFKPYFRTYRTDDLVNCYLCEEVLFIGTDCNSCHSKMHKQCLNKYMTKHNSCPKCKSNWNKRSADEMSQE